MENLICKHIVLSPSYPQNSQEFKEVWVNEFVDWIRNNSTYHHRAGLIPVQLTQRLTQMTHSFYHYY